jgi:hypothetical protein
MLFIAARQRILAVRWLAAGGWRDQLRLRSTVKRRDLVFRNPSPPARWGRHSCLPAQTGMSASPSCRPFLHRHSAPKALLPLSGFVRMVA